MFCIAMETNSGDDDSFDEEAFGEDSDQDDADPNAGKGNQSSPEKKLQKLQKIKSSKSGHLRDLLASAEEFADILDDAGADQLDLGGSEAVDTGKDKAGLKQLKWEAKKAKKGRPTFKAKFRKRR